MNIFPIKEKKFKLIGSQSESMERLIRRTAKSNTLTSRQTDRSFIGDVTENKFKLISSSIGKGVFCVMKGEVHSEFGIVRVEIHKAFQYLLVIMAVAPFVAFLVFASLPENEFSFLHFLVAIGQTLIIRFVFIGFFFNLLSKESLNRLRDTLDFDWI